MKDDRKLVDPDPVAVALGIFSAIGTIAAIADAAQNGVYRANDQREKLAGRSRDILRIAVNLEAAVNDLQVDYETIKSLFYANLDLLPNQEQVVAGALGDPFLLGQFKLVLSHADFRAFSRAHEGIAKRSAEIIGSSYDLISAMRDQQIGLSEETFEKIVSLRVGVNRMLSNRLPYDEALDVISELIGFSSQACRDIKQEFLPGSPPSPQRRRFGSAS
jgi:hypothetical protein